MSIRLPAVVGVLGLVVASSLAGPLRPQRIDADASWMAHVDVERLRASTIGRFLDAHGDELDLELEEVRRELGIDPQRDVYGVTIYGNDHPEQDATVVLEMSRAVDDLIEKLQQEEGYTRLEVEGHVVHGWQDGETTYAHVINASEPERRVVVLAGSAEDVVAAANVIEGRRRSLAQAIGTVGGPERSLLPEAGSIAFVYAKGLPWLEPGDDPASTIARRSDRVRAELRESDGMTTLDLVISACSDSDARNISDVLEGLIALGALLGDQEPELAPLGELRRHITVSGSGSGNDVQVTLRASARDLEACLESMVDDDP